MTDLREKLGETLDSPVSRVSRLHGGMIARVQLVELEDGRRLVVKDSRETALGVEARMLEFLRTHTSLPVPEVVSSSDDLLLLEYVEGDSSLEAGAERHAAELLAQLHSICPGEYPGHDAAPSTHAFGFYFDTLIGPFPQRNAWNADWAEFFRTERLERMLAECVARGRIDGGLVGRLQALFSDIGRRLDHAPRSGLIHGDVWSGNILSRGGQIAALIDPAIYFADPEVELAFIELFSTFGGAFRERYEELCGVSPGYSESRRDIYQLYPLLVHVALFGRSYVGAVEERLGRLGY